MSELREYLKTVDSDLAEQLGQVWKKAKSGIHDAIQTKEGHIGGLAHSEAVEHNLWRLIPEEWRNTDQCRPVDLFLLSAAAALHDAGRVPFGDDFDPDLDHGRLSEKRIRADPGKFELSQHEADVVGMIVRPHNDGDLSTLDTEGWPLNPHGMVDVRKWAALLRLGDILHIAGRVSPQVIDSSELAGKARAKTLFRELVAGWELVDDRQAIRLFASAATSEEYDVVLGGAEVTARDLEPIAAALQSYGLPHRFTIPKVDTDKIKWAEEERAKEARALIGLDYFHENDAEAFKGRDNEIAELQQRVIGNQVSLLVGASGAGKTSLILAGLFPRMKRAGWRCVHTRPWLAANALVRREDFESLLGYVPEPDVSLATIVDKASERWADREVLICMDQFEDASELMPLDAGNDFRHTLSVIQSGKLAKVHLLIAYRVEGESSLGPVWQEAAGSAAGLPRVYLNPLSRRGAEQALTDALLRSKTGLQPRDLLMEQMLDDLESETLKLGYASSIYPPYVRMVAETVAQQAADTGGVFSQDSYTNLGTARQIIGGYLLQTMGRLGEHRGDGEKVLRSLTTSVGTKSAISAERLVAETGLHRAKLSTLLKQLVNLRLVRFLGADYEIAHDCLADLVRLELVEKHPSELLFKAMRETLSAITRSHPVSKTLLDAGLLSTLYPYRKRLALTKEERLLVAVSLVCYPSFMSQRIGWFWVRDCTREEFVHESASVLDHPDLFVRYFAINVIRELGTRDDAARIRQTLSEKNSSLRSAAIAVLVKLESRDDVPLICGMLSDEDAEVRHSAVDAVGQLGSNAEFPLIESMLHDEDQRVREAAVKALVRLSAADALPLVRGMLENEDQGMRVTAMEMFGEIATGEDVPVVQAVIAKGDHSVYRDAVKAFAKLARLDDLPLIVNMLDDHEWRVREAAVTALGHLGSEDSLSLARRMLADNDGDVRCAAIEALGHVGTSDDAVLAQQMLGDSNRAVRLAAIRALGKLGNNSDLHSIHSALVDGDSAVRLAAVELFGTIGTKAELPLVQEMLSDVDRGVRRATVELFGMIGTRSELPPIQQMLTDKDEVVREAAVEVFGTIGEAAELPLVQEMLSDKDEDVREAAAQAFVRLTSREELPLVRGMLRDRNTAVRRAGALAFGRLATEDEIEAELDVGDLEQDVVALLDGAAYMPDYLQPVIDSGLEF